MTVRQLALTIPMVVVVLSARPAGAQSPSVSVGGVIYTNFHYQLDRDTSLAVDGRRNNFDVERSYITVSSKSGIFSGRVTADVDGRRAASNQQTIRLKYAYVALTPTGSQLTLKLGAVQTPFIEFDEAMWGYRMQGTMAMQRNGYLTSSDFGFSADMSWMNQGLEVAAGVFNGEGYSGAPGDQYKDVAGRISVRLLRSDDASRLGGLRATGFALVGQRNGGGPRERYLGMLSWRSKALTVAAQYATTTDSLSGTAPEVEGEVISAYATYGVPASPIRLLARVDVVDPDADSEPDTPSLGAGRQTRVIAGVSYQATPNVRFLADADFASLNHGSPSPAFEGTRRTLYFHAEYKF
ncbi:MAG: hypothetical protein H0W15_13535 [Gemmatimonadales bacterium]|nr:hypothetical protein [Gemmatimonadales bacterium]